MAHYDSGPHRQPYTPPRPRQYPPRPAPRAASQRRGHVTLSRHVDGEEQDE